MTVFNKNSWHYKMAYRWGSHNLEYQLDEGEVNLCPYVRAIVWGMAMVATLTMALGTLLMWPLLGLIGIILDGIWWGDLALVLYTFVAISAIIAMFAGFQVWRDKKRLDEYSRYNAFLHGGGTREEWDAMNGKTRKEPSIVSLWLRSAHEKVCPQISFK